MPCHQADLVPICLARALPAGREQRQAARSSRGLRLFLAGQPGCANPTRLPNPTLTL
jgi:hypothetical protein